MKSENLVAIINNIKSVENIDIDEDAINFIINVSNNTIKIIINYLEKFKLLGEKITLNLAIQLCSNISFLTLEEYTNYIKMNNLKEAIKIILEIYDKGYSVMDILDNYFLFIKSTTILTEEQKYNRDYYLNRAKNCLKNSNACLNIIEMPERW
jgi:DNA polymerase III gamma/tau subunit